MANEYKETVFSGYNGAIAYIYAHNSCDTIKNLQFPDAEIPSMEIGGSLDVLLLAGELLAIDSSGSWGVRFCCCCLLLLLLFKCMIPHQLSRCPW